MRGSRNFRQGGPGQCDKKSSYVFFKVPEGVQHFPGGSNFFQGGGGSNCLFPIETRNPYNLWFSRGGPDPLPPPPLWIRTCVIGSLNGVSVKKQRRADQLFSSQAVSFSMCGQNSKTVRFLVELHTRCSCVRVGGSMPPFLSCDRTTPEASSIMRALSGARFTGVRLYTLWIKIGTNQRALGEHSHYWTRLGYVTISWFYTHS